MISFILKCYMWLHEILHKRIVSRLGCAVYGLHPKEALGRRFELFWMYVGKDDIVIDIACGSGSILHAIKDKIKQGYGIDLSQKQIDLCNKLHAADNLYFQRADILNTDYKQARAEIKYNVAIYSHILEHIDNVPEFLNKVDADRILVCVPSCANWYRLLMKDLGLDIRTDRGHKREYDVDMLLEEIDAARYEPEVIGYNSDGDLFCAAKKIKKR